MTEFFVLGANLFDNKLFESAAGNAVGANFLHEDLEVAEELGEENEMRAKAANSFKAVSVVQYAVGVIGASFPGLAVVSGAKDFILGFYWLLDDFCTPWIPGFGVVSAQFEPNCTETAPRR